MGRATEERGHLQIEALQLILKLLEPPLLNLIGDEHVLAVDHLPLQPQHGILLPPHGGVT